MPRRSQAQEFTWPPRSDDLAIMDLDGAGEVRKPSPPLPHPRTSKGPRTTSEPGVAKGSAPVRELPLQHRAIALARRVPPRAATAGLALLVLVASAAVLFKIVIAAGEPGSPGPVPTTAAASASVSPPEAAPPGAAAVGSLVVTTQPAGAEVVIDGKTAGRSPVTLREIAAGEHSVTVRARSGATVRHTARVEPGEKVAIVVALSARAAPAPRSAPVAAASVSVRSPIELRVTEDGRLLGTSEMDSIPISPGTHTLVLSNEDVGYEGTHRVTVSAGRRTRLDVRLPQERVAVNALPWAEVEVDGRPVGQTPIGALELPLGPHVFVLRHPKFGERTVRTTVKSGETARISVDLRR